MQITDQMLIAAMRKATEHGLLPRQLPADEYLRQMLTMKDILQAALDAS